MQSAHKVSSIINILDATWDTQIWHTENVGWQWGVKWLNLIATVKVTCISSYVMATVKRYKYLKSYVNKSHHLYYQLQFLVLHIQYYDPQHHLYCWLSPCGHLLNIQEMLRLPGSYKKIYNQTIISRNRLNEHIYKWRSVLNNTLFFWPMENFRNWGYTTENIQGEINCNVLLILLFYKKIIR